MSNLYTPGAPPIKNNSYVILWENGSTSVDWEWTGINANLIIAHYPIPLRPELNYDPKAYLDPHGHWCGSYSFPKKDIK